MTGGKNSRAGLCYNQLRGLHRADRDAPDDPNLRSDTTDGFKLAPGHKKSQNQMDNINKNCARTQRTNYFNITLYFLLDPNFPLPHKERKEKKIIHTLQKI